MAFTAQKYWDERILTAFASRRNIYSERAIGGKSETGVATVAILGHPSNHDAPQRMRIWDKNGEVFFNYAPTQEHAWRIEPGKQILLRYRLVLTDGAPDPKLIDRYWHAYK